MEGPASCKWKSSKWEGSHTGCLAPLYIATLQSKPTKQQASTAAEVYHHMKYIIKALLHPMHTVHAHD